MQRTHEGVNPITWCGIITVTCLVLFLFQKILWLVVPFLLALVLHYLLAPLVKRMVLAGLTYTFSAGVLTGIFLMVLTILFILLYPWMMANAVHFPTVIARYLAGGFSILDALLEPLERHFLVKANFSEALRFEFQSMQQGIADRQVSMMLSTIAFWLPSLLLVPVIAFFMLKEGAYFRKFIGSAVPNAYFEQTLSLIHAIDRVAKLYLLGLVKVVLLDMTMLWVGFSLLEVPFPILLGALAAIVGQIPYIGPLLGCVVALLVAGTHHPGDVLLAYQIIGLFLVVRLLDDIVFIPHLIGKNLSIHPLLSILMLFIGGSIAGVAGLMLVLPVLGVVMLLGKTLEQIITDRRLRARYVFSQRLREREARRDLDSHRS
ncbi:MAG: AI-2E family transporter [Methylophilaceae bacterium]|nr:AI-2E family transporter [Methylophilaceae bacterium]